jgi:UrcA family protein
MKNLTTLVAIAALATCILSAAQANAANAPRSETVRFADLNTADAKDTVVLYQRVVLAAHSACRDLEVSGWLSASMKFSNCWHQAVKNAVQTVNLPALTEYAAARGFVSAGAAIQIARSN